VAANAFARKMHRFTVNIKTASIFNRVFEVQKSAKKAEILTKSRAFGTELFAFTISALTMTRPYAMRTVC
jgi:hypothetical protein